MDKRKLKETVSHGTIRFPLAAYRWEEPDCPLKVDLHWHEETEIVFFEKGAYLVSVNMKDYRIQSPAFLFIRAGDIHSIRSLEPGRESAVVFDLKMLSFEYFDDVQYQIIKPLLEGVIRFPQFLYAQTTNWQQLKELYTGLQEDAESQTTDAKIRQKARLYGMLALFYRDGLFEYSMKVGDRDNYKLANTKKILSFLQENYPKRIRAEDMAYQLGMNTQYFCRYFKKLTGKTPNGYLNEIRLEKAAQLLAETDRKIIDIAMACGYDNMGYFIKRFTQQKGMNPSTYRKFTRGGNNG